MGLCSLDVHTDHDALHRYVDIVLAQWNLDGARQRAGEPSCARHSSLPPPVSSTASCVPVPLRCRIPTASMQAPNSVSEQITDTGTLGYRHPRPPTDNTPRRRRERCSHVERHVPPEHPAHRSSLQRISDPQQHGVPASVRRVHPDAQGACLSANQAVAAAPHPTLAQAFNPVAILLISWSFRIKEPSKRLAVIVFMISAGVALASRGELRFNLVGFITQAAAVAVRTVSAAENASRVLTTDCSSRHQGWS